MKLQKIPKIDKDYIEFYALELKKNPKLFKQQKTLINNQIQSSRSFFKNLFRGKDFKKEARVYLKARNLI